MDLLHNIVTSKYSISGLNWLLVTTQIDRYIIIDVYTEQGS